MSIEKDPSTQQQAPQARTYGGAAPAGDQKVSLDNIRRTAFARGGIGETTHVVASRIKKRIEEAGGSEADMYSVQILDNERSRSYFSVVLVTKAVRAEGRPVVATFGLLIESSAKKLPPRLFTIGNQQHSLQTAPSDAVDDDLFELITSHLKNEFGNDAAVAVVGVQVLPTEFSMGDDANSNALDALLFNATQALSTEMVKGGIIDERPADARLIARNGQAVIGRDTDPPPLYDAAGLPIRSDLSISLRQVTDQNQSVWKPNAVSQPDLTRLEGYIDLDYHEPQLQANNPYGQGGINPLEATRRYIPRFVITRMDVLTKAITPEMVLLALSTAAFAGYNNAWLEAFRPRPSKDDVNLRDISAIGYEVNLTGADEPERLPLPGASDMGKFYQMLSMAIKPDLLLSIDIDEAGEQSWMLQDLYAAARGNVNGIQNLITAADRLTDGVFSQQWDPKERIAVDEDNRIALGYWVDKRGEKRDLRELDYVAMLNLVGAKEIGRLHDRSATFYNNTGEPQELRLERRERIDREVLPTYTLKGWARRIVINPQFVVTLANALAVAGLVPRPSDSITDLTGQTVRGNYTTASMAMNFNNAGINFFSAGRSGLSGVSGLGAASMGHYGGFRGFGA